MNVFGIALLIVAAVTFIAGFFFSRVFFAASLAAFALAWLVGILHAV